MAIGDGTINGDGSVCTVVFVVLPGDQTFCDAAVKLIEQTNRSRWYPMVILEDGGLRLRDGELLSDVARSSGVPVMICRKSSGKRWQDFVRTLLDERFFVKESDTSMVCVVGTPAALQESPSRLLGWVASGTPIFDVRLEEGMLEDQAVVKGRAAARTRRGKLVCYAEVAEVAYQCCKAL